MLNKIKILWVVVPLTLFALLLSISITSASEISQIRLRSRTITPADATTNTVYNQPYGLIQFAEIPTQAQRDELANAGVTLFDYIPDLTWTAAFAAPIAPAQHNYITMIAALSPSDKRSAAFDSLLASLDSEIEVNIVLWDSTSLGFLDQYGTVTATNQHYTTISMDKTNLDALFNEINVQWMDPVTPATSLTDDIIAITKSDVLIKSGLSGAGLTAGIFDLGAPEPHVDFADRLTIKSMDQAPYTHATLVSGIVANMATDVHINSYDFGQQDDLKNNQIDVAVHVWGIEDCRNLGHYNIYSKIYDFYTIPMIVSAGNLRGECKHVFPDVGAEYTSILPGLQSSKNVISVGNTLKTNGFSLAPNSSIGPTQDGRIAPTFVAPGTDITSTCGDDGYCTRSGTSYSAPGLAGAAVLLTEAYQQENGTSDTLTSADLRVLFAASATDLGNLGPDYKYGFGLINAEAARNILPFLQHQTAINTIQNTTTVDVPDGKKLNVVLAWHDVPASTLAETQLINDLDLTLKSPSGEVHYPFVLDPNSPHVTATRGSDHRNTMEQIVVPNAEPGTWQINVNGTFVPLGTQPYSIVYQMLDSAPLSVTISSTVTNLPLIWMAIATFVIMLLLTTQQIVRRHQNRS